jgi:hypothetical protein
MERVEVEDGYAEVAYATGDDDDFIFPHLHRHAELCALYRLWLEARRGAGGRLPRRADFSPETLRPWLGWINLLTVVDGGRDYVYRLFGSNIAREAGHDLTGKSIFVLPAIHQPVISGPFAAVVAEGRPCCTRHVMYREGRSLAWERLVLPLAEDGRTPNILLIGLYRVPTPTR